MNRQHRNVRYSRILVAGITLSVAVHFVLFELGGFDLGSESDSVPVPVVFTPPPANSTHETTAYDPEPLRSAQAAAAPNELPEIEADLQVALELAEYPGVLADADAPVIPPLVPRPRVRPERTDQGFTPVRLAPRMALGSPGSGADAIGITFVIGDAGRGGHGPRCHPTRLPVRYSRHGPASPSSNGFGGFFPRR